MKIDIKNFPRGLDEKDLLYLIWEALSGGESGEKGFLNSGRRKFPDGLDRADILYLIWKQLTSGERQFSSRYEASNITEIDPKVLDALKCGDQVAKITGDQKHIYIVTYKGDGVGEGICLSYFAAGYLETVSYDYTSNGWAYNSTDVVEVGSGGSGGGGGDVQIVELTYDHIPATGTLSASDLAKLDSDNCLLVMNGKYFRKTFSSASGIDYKEIGLATILGGLRSIYFTASKPDGEYTIAYTYPVEANTQAQATTALENIKVGNTTYSVPPAPMVVAGTIEEGGAFVPNEDEPTSWSEAREHMFSGGLLYLQIVDDGEPVATALAGYAGPADIVATTDYGNIVWAEGEGEGEGE